MSPSEVQIQEFLANVSPGVEESQGPMPSSAFQALAPGEQVVPDSRAEWREEAGIATSDEQAEELIASFDTPPGDEAGAGDSSPSEAAEEETGQATSDELSPAVFDEGSETVSQETTTEGDQEGATDTDEEKNP